MPMNLSTVFSSKDRVKMLRSIIYSETPLSVSGLSRTTSLSKGFASKYLNSLVRDGLLKKSGVKFILKDNLNMKALRIMLNFGSLDCRAFGRHGFVRGAGIYGSFANGSNTESSDIDIWVLIDKASQESLAKLTSELRKAMGDVKPLYLTREKLKELRKRDELFYHSLVFGSITIWGDDIETI